MAREHANFTLPWRTMVLAAVLSVIGFPLAVLLPEPAGSVIAVAVIACDVAWLSMYAPWYRRWRRHG